MDIRPAKQADAPAIRDVATRSLEASYSLGPRTIEAAVDSWYDESAIERAIDRADRLLLVAERQANEHDIIGFSDSSITGDTADIMWLHVDPEYRDLGIGTALFDETQSRLLDKGAERMRGRVLDENVDGVTFYESLGLERAGEETVDIDGDTHTELIFIEPSAVELDTVAGPDGEEIYIDSDTAETGSRAPFYVAYLDRDRETKYGYYCKNCESLATAMDAMGRVECSNCGNVRQPTRWDAAYL